MAYELIDGQIEASAARTENHGLILTNLAAGLKGRGLRPWTPSRDSVLRRRA